MSNKTNKFRRAIHHLKSDQIDERMAVLEAAPTNSTQNLMTVEPSVQVASTYETVSLGLDFDKGNDDDGGTDTSGIFESDGTILTLEPDVGDTSYILGPMASMWYAWGNFTRIGYIQQDTRRMVNLGTLTGPLGSWDGSADGFTSYGQLTLAQADWFRTIGKKDGADNNTPNYRAFYPGPPSGAADSFGRYLACIVGEGKTETTGNPRSTSNPKNAPEDPSTQFSGELNQYEKNKNKSEEDEWDELLKQARKIDADSKVTVDTLNARTGTQIADAGLLTLPAGIALWKVASLVAASAYMTLPELRQAVSSWNGVYQSTSDKSWEDEFLDSPAGQAAKEQSREQDIADTTAARERVQAADEALDDAIASGDQGRIDAAQTEVDNAAKNQERVQAQVAANRRGRGTPNRPGQRNRPGQKGTTGQVHGEVGMYSNSYKPQGKLISEERIWLREIKKPVKVPELQKKFKGIKPKVKKKGDYKIVGGGLMKDNIAPPEFSPTRENRLWRKYEVNQNRRASQEKKNQVLELIGEGDHQWNHMLGNERWRSASQMKKFYGDHDYLYDYYYGGKKHKVLRKEGLEKDFLVFIEDENGFKDTILQSELNELLAEERDKEDFKEYYMKETEQKEREKNFDRATKLKSIVGRIKRGDIKPEYPNEPPPKMINGYHPKFGKKYKHDKLDPVSARSMPRTGDPEIDANVEKAKRQPK